VNAVRSPELQIGSTRPKRLRGTPVRVRAARSLARRSDLLFATRRRDGERVRAEMKRHLDKVSRVVFGNRRGT
jgi:hypothetical protein